MIPSLKRCVFLAAAAAACAVSVSAAEQSSMSQPPPPMYVISDLHFGVGRAGGADWHPMEDFRWANAFRGFLRGIEKENPGGVQLVVAGDFLELWQHPTVACVRLKDTECGCSIDEMKQIVADVLEAHSAEFAAIDTFLGANPNNRVIVLPGNHDAALAENAIWAMVAEKVKNGRDRFTRVDDGLLITQDQRIAIEHGHQQGFDVNYFPDWPRGVIKQCGAARRFFRPWGENFVQSLYNDVEAKFPLIDNMVPDSAGKALYELYSEQRGTKWVDVARFVEFNLLQTSIYQKIAGLNLTKPNEQLTPDKVRQCRQCLAEELFVIGNPLAEEMLRRGGDDAKNLREALRQRERSLGGNEAKMLCERAVLVNGGTLPLNRTRTDDPLCSTPLATGVKSIFDPDGSLTLRTRLAEIYDRSKGRLAIYVFGHTHEARLNMPVEMPDGLTVAAFNTGAFQRLMSRTYFDAKRRPNEGEIDELSRLTFNDLQACYTTVKIAYKGRRTEAQLKQWFMEESDTQGVFLDDCDARCSAPPANCAKRKQR